MFEAALKRYVASHELLANWRPECFEQIAVYTPRLSEEYGFCELKQLQCREAQIWCADAKAEGVDQKALEKSDKTQLQSYGRPYDSKGAPAPTSFYSFAKGIDEVTAEKAWLCQTSTNKGE